MYNREKEIQMIVFCKYLNDLFEIRDKNVEHPSKQKISGDGRHD